MALGISVAALTGLTLFVTAPAFISPALACSGGDSGGGSGGEGSSDGGGDSDATTFGDPSTPPIGYSIPNIDINTGDSAPPGPIGQEIQALISKVNKLQQEYQTLLKDMRPGTVKQQARQEKEVRQHQRNADLLTIAKYGLHVYFLSSSLKGIRGPSPKDFSKWAYPVAVADNAKSNVGIAQDVVDTVKAAEEAVKAAQSLAAANPTAAKATKAAAMAAVSPAAAAAKATSLAVSMFSDAAAANSTDQ